ncbi:MAG: hypothetical protein IJZ57_08690 [Clostridia bacterium]|nr:hypothetical protein [Clostridia bacterium]
MNNSPQPDNVNKAQAESSPELSSILREMKNGTDIQPLDDIQQSDFVEFEDNVTDSKLTDDEKEDIEPSRHTTHKKESPKRLIRAAVVVTLILCVLAGIYIAFFHIDDFAHGTTAVYEKDSAVNVLLENNDTIRLEDVAQLKLSDDGKVLVYSQDTDSKTGKYDIRVIDFSKRTSVKNKGSVIVSGIEENWYMDKSGCFVYYQKAESGSVKYYVYSTENRETEMIVADATEFFAPPMGDIAYYTRERAGTTMLYRKRFGEETESLGDAKNVKATKSDEVMEIFYTVPGDDAEKDDFTLYKISGDSRKIKIADNVSEVYLDDYTPGGNLYYFVKNEANLNWNDFVDDPYYDSDSTAQKPDKGDYLVTVGFIFKRTKLDEQAYNRAMAEYNKKLTRDKIREALDRLDFGLAVSAEYKVKVYDGQLSKELAGSVKLENLIAFAKTGAPRIIYKTSGIDAQQKINMSALYKIAENKTVIDAMDYVISVLNNNYEISTGCKYSWYDGNKVMAYDFDPESDIADCKFDFLGRESIVTCVITGSTDSALYISTVSGKEIAKPALISENVISFEVNGNTLYYTKSNGTKADLYAYDPQSGSALICESNVQFITTDSGEVISFKGIYENDVLLNAELLLCSEGEVERIDSEVSPKHFAVDGNSFAYIKSYQSAAATDTQAQTGGELKLCSDGKTKTLDSGVSVIYSINPN